MKNLKRAFAVLMLVLCAMCFTVMANAAENGVESFSVTTEIDGTEISVNWWQGDGKYFLFLPADATELKASFTASAAVAVDGAIVENGDVLAFENGKTYEIICDGMKYQLTVVKSENLPSLHITTESGSMDAVHASKSHKEKAEIVIISEGEKVADKDLEYIKGRGNSTWGLKKKPYNIKFDKKIDLFGMGKAKKWSLLANYVDLSFMRNSIAYNLAENVGLMYTSKNISVDLFVNGDYYGNYLLCESVEVGETRVDISDLEGDTEDVNENDLDEYALGGAQEENYKNLVAGTQKWVEIPENPDDISGGYLLEFELPNRYVDEVSGFVTDRYQTIVLKAPEYASEAQVKYISALYQEFEDALYSETGYNAKGRHYTEYIDVESFVKMYVFQEYVKNLDAGLTSFYIYKDTDSDVFVASPVWDFDYALGNYYPVYGTNLSYSTGWWASKLYYRASTTAHLLDTILNELNKHDDFFALACEEWNNVYAPVLTAEYFADLEGYSAKISASATMNALRWNLFETADPAAAKATHKQYVDEVVLTFMKERKAFLDDAFGADTVRVFFDANGGEGKMFDGELYKKGDFIVLPFNEFENSGKLFAGWNTKADGTGKSYNALSTATLNDENVTFYAQWTEISLFGGFEKMINFIKGFFESIKSFFSSIFNFI